MVKRSSRQRRYSDGTIDVDIWLAGVDKMHPPDEQAILKSACELAKQYGAKVPVIANEPGDCFTQGLIVADILVDLNLDAYSIAAGLIYYAFVYATLPLTVIKDSLGHKVEYLVLGLQQLDHLHARNPFHVKERELREHSLQNLRKMLLAVVNDIRVVLIKIAIQICNMRMAFDQDAELRTKLALEAREIYAPLANRLGIGHLKWELEDLAFRFLDPESYKSIASQLAERRMDREKYIADVGADLTEALKKEGITAKVSGRAKHIFSIWRKMQRKGVGYKEIYDILAIRVLVNTVTDCYAALGVVHTLWQHLPKEFDDYIARPKANGYRSLHTAVVGSDAKVMEIQIKTKQMHHQAELGVASHWRYKEGVKHEPDYESKLVNLRQLIDWSSDYKYDAETEEALHTELDEERIYVFTPNGDVIDLPKGATALDFAYHIHTELGHRCRGAKVNGKIIPLSQPLNSGQQVEVITAKSGGPSRDWISSHLNYLATSKARAKVHQWFKKQDRSQNIQDGRDILQREFKRLNVDNINLAELAANIHGCNSEEDLLADLGSGDIRVAQVLGALQRLRSPVALPKPAMAHELTKTKAAAKPTEISIDGVGELIFHMAGCCHPILGDEIIGYITLGEGVSIHRQDCPNIVHISDDKRARLINVAWGGKTSDVYEVAIIVKAYNRQWLLKDLSAALNSEDVDIVNVNTLSQRTDQLATFKFNLSVPSLQVLGKVLAKLQHIPNVTEVYREKG